MPIMTDFLQTIAWPFANTRASVSAVAALNGAFQGTFVSLYAPGIAQMGTVSEQKSSALQVYRCDSPKTWAAE
jgi:hypothetical protein